MTKTLVKETSATDSGRELLERAEHELILQAAGEGIYGIDANGRATFVNQAAINILGWELDDFSDKSTHDCFHHSRHDNTPYPAEECPIYVALKDGKVHREDNEVFWTMDGQAVPVEYISTPVFLNDKIIGAVVVFNDISERKKTEKKLQDAFHTINNLKLKYELILQSAGEGIYGVDANGHATFINPSAKRLLGWSLDDVSDKVFHDCHHHSYPDGSPYPVYECPGYAALKDGKVHRKDDEVFWTKDGEAIPVEYISTPIIENDEITGTVIIFSDISERKKAEQKIQDAFEEINSLKNAFEKERDYLREEVELTVKFGEIIGGSSALQRMLVQLEAVASTPANVLIYGESGTGKELTARAIHSRSERAQSPLIKVNCASIPKDLFESEFFGHVKGSFTGAHRDRVGRFELADSGTLFLDEIGEIPLELQSKLLRVLQENEFERIGDEKTKQVDVRIIAATNRDLKEEIKAGHFREDLFYRLSVFPIEVPPLRDRLEDIVPLALHFLDKSCKNMGKCKFDLTREQGRMLENYNWPGNIRELEHVIARAAILSKDKHLQLDESFFQSETSGTKKGTKIAEELPKSDFLTVEEFKQREKENMIAALEHCDWRVSGKGGAAELLGIKPTTLSHQMKKLNIQKPAEK